MSTRRTKDEIRRIPQDDDQDDDGLPERIRYFGGRLALKPGRAKLAALLLAAVSLSGHVVRVLGGSPDWWPDYAALNYTLLALRYTLLGLALYLYVKTLNHTEREFEVKLARNSWADEHTPEEAARYRNRFYRYRFLLTVTITLTVLGLYVLIGTDLVFPWGGFLLYLGVMLAVIAIVFLAYPVLLFHEEIISNLRWWAYCLWRARRRPRQPDKDGRR